MCFKLDKYLVYFPNFILFAFFFFRTPWCVAFHPSYNGLLASGCLGGHVRIWDLNGCSELWKAENVIASLAFHPIERLLVIATSNELHFWDWSQTGHDEDPKNPKPSKPFCKVATKSEKEKVRYVKFDSLGHHLITGIANTCNGMNPNNLYSQVRGPMAINPRVHPREARILARSRGRYGAHNPYRVDMLSTASDSSPTYGRYYRGMVDPIVRPRPQPPTERDRGDRGSSPSTSSTIPTSTSSSASQTLLDLAAVASDRLMAGNVTGHMRAAAAAAEAAEAAAEAAAVIPRTRRLMPSSYLTDDPLLSDHPYGVTNGRPPPPTYSEMYSMRPSSMDVSRSLSDSMNMRERRLHHLLMRFRHSPESSFEVYTSPRLEDSGLESPSDASTEMYANPERSSDANNRYREIRERRMQRQRERQRQLQIQTQLRYQSLRIPDYLLSRETTGSSSAASTRPIDDWAINRRLTLQQGQVDPLLRLNT